MIDKDYISDELLAAYLDGNVTPEEEALVASFINADETISEAIDIAIDSNLFATDDIDFLNNTFDTAYIPVFQFSPEIIDAVIDPTELFMHIDNNTDLDTNNYTNNSSSNSDNNASFDTPLDSPFEDINTLF